MLTPFYPGYLLMSSLFQSLRYIKPPDSLLTQLDIYTEEKFEDEEDLRERSLANHRRTVSDSEVIVQETLDVARRYDEVYPLVVAALSHIRIILEKDSDVYVILMARRTVRADQPF